LFIVHTNASPVPTNGIGTPPDSINHSYERGPTNEPYPPRRESRRFHPAHVTLEMADQGSEIATR
ncbi:MAG: hypothetical protein ACP5GA_10340, partial [Acidithiobacillus sp.]